MPSKFLISFDSPEDAEGIIELVIEENALQSESGSQEPTIGPLTKIESPAISINTSTAVPTGGVTSLSVPDVSIYPTATSTSGQPSVIHRTESTGITMVWSEAVTGFEATDITTTVQSDTTGSRATISNFRGFGHLYAAVVNFPASGTGIVIVTIGAFSAESAMTMNSGPISPRSLSLAYDFARGVVTGKPRVAIQLPSANPYIGRKAPISFLWNVPVTGFTAGDVTFTNGVTMSTPTLNSQNNRLWEAELTLPAVTSNTTTRIIVRQDAATSLDGVPGPECQVEANFVYNTSASIATTVPTGTTEICNVEFTAAGHTWLDTVISGNPAGGAFYGISDLIKDGDYLYGVAQIRKKDPSDDNALALTQQAGAAVFRVHIPSNTCTVVKAYTSVLEAARSLVVHDDDLLYWFEGSHWQYIVGQDDGRGKIANNPRVGSLVQYRRSSGCISDLGKAWRIALGRYDQGDFQKDYGILGGTASPMLSSGGKLWAIPGLGNVNFINYSVNIHYLFINSNEEPDPPSGLTYDPDTNTIGNLGDWFIPAQESPDDLIGLFDEKTWAQAYEIDINPPTPRVLLQGDPQELDDNQTLSNLVYGVPTADTGAAIAANIDNWGVLTYSTDIEHRLQYVPTNGIVPWDLLLEMARITHCILHFHEDLIFFKPRLPIQADLSSVLNTSDTQIDYTSETRSLPSSGKIVIDSEIISYGSAGTTSLSSLDRGENHSIIARHTSGTTFTIVDHVLSEDVFVTPIQEVIIDTDGTNLYNAIEVTYDGGNRTYRTDDATSINKYEEREFAIEAPFLTKHQNQWAKWIADEALKTFKDLQHIIQLTLHPTFEIDIGDYVYLQVPRDEIRRIGQVVQIEYSTEESGTSVSIRTIS